MPRDFPWTPEDGHFPLPREENRFYPADQPGWCDAVALGEAPVWEPARRRRSLPAQGDLLGWSMLLLMAPAFAAGAMLLVSAALPAL
jgi:hypothetical protein